MSEQTAKVVVDEQPTAAEKEEKVLEAAGVDTKADDGVFKVDLRKQSKQKENAIQEQETESRLLDSVQQSEESRENAEVELPKVGERNEKKTEVVLEKVEEEVEEKITVKEEITKEDVVQEASESNNIQLPENIQKVVDFMNETGGSLEDYVRLNADYSQINESTLLYEYYKQTKSHLDKEEIDFLIEDSFSYDEEIDEERDIKRKKLAYKEEVAKAKSYLEGLKSKYYEEVKLGSKLTQDQQKAIDFFNRYSKEQSETQNVAQKQKQHFDKVTNDVFNEEFKGFDFSVGDSKFRYKVSDVNSVKEVQSDIMNVISKYLDNNNMLSDAKGYHKALFAAQNADAIANHFYEQGKADAIKEISLESKNINMDARKSPVVEAGGIKVRAITGEDSSKLKIKLRK